MNVSTKYDTTGLKLDLKLRFEAKDGNMTQKI